MQITYMILSLFVLFIIELTYFKIANKFNIIDKPNERSSHQLITIRGGGIIFSLAAIFYCIANNFNYPFFFIGLTAIAAISFIDDILTLNNKIRISVHLIAVLLLFWQWDILSLNWYWLLLIGVFIIAAINAYNFMDGINGITGIYSLLCVLTLYYINDQLFSFIDQHFLTAIVLSLLVFNYFNFRTKAKCFAGDVGSVGIAFILIFLIGSLILKSENFNYILLLMIYGLDTFFTIVFRKIRGENIFNAHRTHFYQFLANEKKFSHLWVTVLYFLTQLGINYIILFYVKNNSLLALLFTSLLAIIFLIIRLILERPFQLYKKSL